MLYFNRVDDNHLEVLDGQQRITSLGRFLTRKFAIRIIGMEQYIPGKALVGTALNVFYDTLKKEDPKLYDDMSATGSLTFYYLAYRREGNQDRRVAQAFAMLCGNEESEDLIQVGEAIYHRYRHMVREYVEGIGFEPEDQ